MLAVLGADVGQRPAHARVPTPRERPDVGADVNLPGLHLARQAGQLVLRRSTAQHEPAAALAQAAVEIGQAVEQELSPRRRAVTTAQQACVEAEDRQDLVVGAERGLERGMVGQAQVPAQPDQRRHAA